jgi:dethiobiotin synthase
MEGVFVIGIDTGVGKTSVCAGLVKLLHGTRKVVYWKPVQTGTIVGDDTKEVKRLTEFPAETYMEPAYRFPDPLSPHWAAKKWGKTIDLAAMQAQFAERKKTAGGAFFVLEGAGGLLVPYNSQELQIDFIRKIGMPMLIIAEDRVGAINQTLLTLNAARDHKLPILGVILTRSRRTLGNAEAITHFGKCDILAEFDPVEDVRTLVGQVGAHSRLREVFQVGSLPH